MFENIVIVSGLALFTVSLVMTLLRQQSKPARIPVRIVREQRRK